MIRMVHTHGGSPGSTPNPGGHPRDGKGGTGRGGGKGGGGKGSGGKGGKGGK